MAKLSAPQLDILRRAARRSDGRVYKIGILQRTLDILQECGAVEQRKVAIDSDTIAMAERLRDSDIRDATAYLIDHEWKDALRLLRNAEQRQKELDERGLFITAYGRSLVEEGK